MFFITYGSQVRSISTDKESLLSALRAEVKVFTDQWAVYAKQGNSNYQFRSYGTLKAYLDSGLRSFRVYEFEGSINLINLNRAVEENKSLTEITSDYIDCRYEDAVYAHATTALVTKKGLRTSGKRLRVMSTPEGFGTSKTDMKELFDKMVRVTVSEDGWGNLSMSPSSLGEYETTPLVRKAYVCDLKFKLED